MPTLDRSPSTSLPLMAALASAGHTLGGVPLTIGGVPGKIKITTIKILQPVKPIHVADEGELLHQIDPRLLDGTIKPRLDRPRDVVAARRAQSAAQIANQAARRVALSLPPKTQTPSVGADEGWGYVPPLCTDQDLHDAIRQQATSLLATSDLNNDVNKVWEQILDGIKKGAAVGATIATIDIALFALHFEVIANLLIELVNLIVAAIAQALAVTAATTVTSSIAIGGTFGYVGAAIGAIVGGCIALGNILYGGQHLQIDSTGASFSCKDYVGTNIQSAADWLNKNQDKLTGLTALRFAKQANLFVANPYWTWLNQDKMGVSFPNPPDPNSGDALDCVYQLVPGALEMLNRAQFLIMVAQMNANPGHLDFYMGIYKPVPGQEVALTNRYPSGYASPAKAPAGKTLYGQPAHGQGVYPDPIFANGWKQLSPMIAANPGDPYSAPSKTRVQWGIGVVDPNGMAFSYTAPPNLWSNDNTYCTGQPGDGCPRDPISGGIKHAGTWPDGQGKINGQTDICPGIYNAQVLWPSVTTAQVEMCAAGVSTAYNVVPDILPSSAEGAPLPPDPTIHPVVPQLVLPSSMASFGPDMHAVTQEIGTANARYQALLASNPALAAAAAGNVPRYPTVATLTVVPAVAPPRVRGLSRTTSLGLGLLTIAGAAAAGIAAAPAMLIGAAGAAIAYTLVGSHVPTTPEAQKIADLPQNRATS